MKTLTVNSAFSGHIKLGRRGEDHARQIVFDLTVWTDTYGPGAARLLHQRPGDPAPYVVPAIQEDGSLIWTVTGADTAATGTGHAEIQWLAGDTLAKSATYSTNVYTALDDGAETPPTGVDGWYQQLIDYIDSAKGAGVTEAEIAAAVASYLADYPVQAPVDSVNGKTGAVALTAQDVGALTQADLQTAVDTALTQAKDSGEFDGAQGPAGPQGEQGDVGPQGPAGPAGADGKDGATPNIQIGTVETLAAGSNATASITGTAYNPLLNLGIPRGADGTGGSSEWTLLGEVVLEAPVRQAKITIPETITEVILVCTQCGGAESGATGAFAALAWADSGSYFPCGNTATTTTNQRVVAHIRRVQYGDTEAVDCIGIAWGNGAASASTVNASARGNKLHACSTNYVGFLMQSANQTLPTGFAFYALGR